MNSFGISSLIEIGNDRKNMVYSSMHFIYMDAQSSENSGVLVLRKNVRVFGTLSKLGKWVLHGRNFRKILSGHGRMDFDIRWPSKIVSFEFLSDN